MPLLEVNPVSQNSVMREGVRLSLCLSALDIYHNIKSLVYRILVFHCSLVLFLNASGVRIACR